MKTNAPTPYKASSGEGAGHSRTMSDIDQLVSSELPQDRVHWVPNLQALTGTIEIDKGTPGGKGSARLSSHLRCCESVKTVVHRLTSIPRINTSPIVTGLTSRDKL